MALSPGDRVGHYEILGSLGAGGMGEVYRAKDTRLKRDVAIKVLPAGVADDAARLARFQREAEVLASLNHPHIAHLYGIEQHALVMELVEGRDLTERIARGPVLLEEALAIARQIADALAAAHDAGIVHRDLKPGNIRISTDGTVKVLDFGLAKALDRTEDAAADDTITALPATMRGQVVGTAAYMSPEQAQGLPVDKRTDIWAFGCVLLEMMTGRRAFRGVTPSDTLASVLRDAPPLDTLPASTPPRIRLLIARCLERDPKRRLRDIGDARLELEDTAPTATPSATRSFGRRSRLALALGLLVSAVVGVPAVIDRMRPRATPATAPVIRLTSDEGLTTDPALSPDGKLLVFASDRAGAENLDLWAQQVDGGTPLRLTSDPGNEDEASFSPDGTRIVFRSDRDGGGIYTMPALGGEARLVAKEGRQPRFSPDGLRIAYVTGNGASQGSGSRGGLFVVPAAGGAAVELTSVGAASPVWSPDATFILFAEGQFRTDRWAITRSDLGSSVYLPLAGFRQAGVADPTPRAWLDGNRVVFDARSGDTSHVFDVHLRPPSWWIAEWRLDATPAALTFGTAQDERPTVSTVAATADGGLRVAFASVSRQENVWSVAVDASRPATGGVLKQLTRGTGEKIFPWASDDGTKVVFIDHAAYNDQVSLLDTTTGKVAAMSTGVSAKFQSFIRADGSQIYYSDMRDESAYAVSVSRGVTERLCDRCGWVWDWSADRKWLLAFTLAKRVGMSLVDLQSAKRTTLLQLDNEDLYDFRLSPDGRWMSFKTENANRNRIYVAAFDGEHSPPRDAWIPITDGSTREGQPDWSPDGHWLYAMSDRDGFRCVWAYAVDEKSRQPVGTPVAVYHTHGARLALRNADQVSQRLSVGHKAIVFNQGEVTGNIWMTELRK